MLSLCWKHVAKACLLLIIYDKNFKRQIASVVENVQVHLLQGMLRQASQVCVILLMCWISGHGMGFTPCIYSVQPRKNVVLQEYDWQDD